jgi:hypothetical protein
MNTGQQHAINIEQRLNPRRVFLLEQIPLRRGESKVMLRVPPGHATSSDLLQLLILRRRMNNQRRVQLLEHIPIPLQQHPEKLGNIVRHHPISTSPRIASTRTVSRVGSEPFPDKVSSKNGPPDGSPKPGRRCAYAQHNVTAARPGTAYLRGTPMANH